MYKKSNTIKCKEIVFLKLHLLNYTRRNKNMGVQNYYWHNEKITTKTDIEHYGLRNCYFSSISYPNFHDSSVNYDFGYHEYQATMP